MDAKLKRSDLSPHDYVQLWGVLVRPEGAPATGSADVVWIAPSRETAERWVKENPGTQLMQSVKQAWEYV